jgi:hypothetical protein
VVAFGLDALGRPPGAVPTREQFLTIRRSEKREQQRFERFALR